MIPMKNITKRIIAVFSVLCVAMAGFTGCGDKNNTSNNSDTSEDVEAAKQYALEIGSAKDGNPLAADPGIDLAAEDPTGDTTDAEPATEIEDVTDSDGQPVTEVVTVTDASGETVTNASGEAVTETVKATTVVTKKNSGNSGSSTESSGSSYTPKEDGRYAMWLDISKDENFYFEDDFLHIKFKVKDDAPDGDYKFKISPDLSDVKGTAVYPSKVLEGTIRVNKGSIEPVDVSNETGMVFYGDNVACKQGDTIDYYINIKNNSGLVAFVIWFYFDSNAFDFISAEASGDFEEIARNTEIGSVKKAEE
jgi:hypothetical protein